MLTPITCLAIELVAIFYNDPQKKHTVTELHTLTKGRFITKYMEEILRRLKILGVVKSKRGPNGGYMAGSRSDITLLEIVNCYMPCDAAFGNAAEKVQKDLDKYLSNIFITKAVEK